MKSFKAVTCSDRWNPRGDTAGFDLALSDSTRWYVILGKIKSPQTRQPPKNLQLCSKSIPKTAKAKSSKMQTLVSQSCLYFLVQPSVAPLLTSGRVQLSRAMEAVYTLHTSASQPRGHVASRQPLKRGWSCSVLDTAGPRTVPIDPPQDTAEPLIQAEDTREKTGFRKGPRWHRQRGGSQGGNNSRGNRGWRRCCMPRAGVPCSPRETPLECTPTLQPRRALGCSRGTLPAAPRALKSPGQNRLSLKGCNLGKSWCWNRERYKGTGVARRAVMN